MEELITNTAMVVGTTNIQVSPECFQQRSAIIITNISTNNQVIYLALGEEARVGYGVSIHPGGVYQDTRDGQYQPSNKQINAISSASDGTVAIQERIITGRGRYI